MALLISEPKTINDHLIIVDILMIGSA